MLTVTGTDGTEKTSVASSVLPLNEWVMFTWVKDGSTHRIYANGVLRTQFILDSPVVLFDSYGLGGIVDSDQESFNGIIDIFETWDQALSAQDVADLYGKYLY